MTRFAIRMIGILVLFSPAIALAQGDTFDPQGGVVVVQGFELEEPMVVRVRPSEQDSLVVDRGDLILNDLYWDKDTHNRSMEAQEKFQWRYLQAKESFESLRARLLGSPGLKIVSEVPPRLRIRDFKTSQGTFSIVVTAMSPGRIEYAPVQKGLNQLDEAIKKIDALRSDLAALQKRVEAVK